MLFSMLVILLCVLLTQSCEFLRIFLRMKYYLSSFDWSDMESGDKDESAYDKEFEARSTSDGAW